MTAPADTLVYDTATVAIWQSGSEYDYNRELQTPEVDLIVLAGLFILIVLLLIWFLYKKRPELFMRSGKKLAYHVEEDTIYGIDFEKEISTAMLRNEYREAVRLLYLQTLKQLSDAEKIDWQPYKTPTEYTYELKSNALRTPFRELTNRFLRVRYFEATEALFHEMQTLQREIVKGGMS